MVQEIEVKAGEDENRNQKIKKKDKEKVEQDVQEVSLLKLNLGYMNYLNKNVVEAQRVLKHYFIDKSSIIQNNFIKVKAYFTLLDIYVQKQQWVDACQIYNLLLELKTTVQKEQDQYKENQNIDKQEKDKEDDKFRNDNYNLILFKDQKLQYCSLICGFVIHQSGDYKLLLDVKEFQLFLDLFKVQLLIGFEMHQHAYNCLKQIKKDLLAINSSDTLLNPSQQFDIQNQQLFQFVLKQLFNMFKFIKSYSAFKQNNFKKSIKYLNPNLELKTSLNNMGSQNQVYGIFQLNNLGCIHLSLRKPVLAIYYFTRALEVNIGRMQITGRSELQQLLVKNIVLKLENIKYNLAQGLLMMQKTELAYQTLNSVIQNFSDKHKLWYLIGSQMLLQYQKQLQTNQQNQQYDLIQDILNDYPPTYKNSHQYPGFRRFVLGETDNHQFQSQHQQLLARIISSFRNSLYLLKKQAKVVDKYDDQYRIKLVRQFQQDSGIARSTEQQQQQQEQQQGSSREWKQKLEIKCLLKLGYALLANHQYNAAYNVCQECLQYEISNSQKMILQSYLLEIYLVQGKYQDALELSSVLNKMNQQKDKEMINLVCQNVLYRNKQQFSKIRFETMLLTNMAACELLNNQINQAQKYIKSAFYSLDVSSNQFAQIPLALLNLTVYIQIVNGNYAGAINIVKRKRIFTQNNSSKNILKITK